MAAGTNRVLISTLSLIGLLALGLFVAQTAGNEDPDPPRVASSPPASATSPAPETVEPTKPVDVKRAVEAAYLRQWDVYARAVRTLRPQGLDEVFTGRALEVVRREIARRVRSRTPSRVRVEHRITVRIIDPVTAVVDDRYVNHTVTIDPGTGQATEKDPNQIVHEVYTMKKVEGTWKVSAIVRQSVRPR